LAARLQEDRIQVGISSCLLGEPVRFDGGHKRDRYVTDVLGSVFHFVPVCPEMAIGMGTPRPPIRLQGEAGAPRAVGVADPDQDYTDRLRRFGRRTAHELTDISGYVFKSRSPSCGMERVKVYRPGQPPATTGTGLYAGEIMRAWPNLPVEEEGRLNDPDLRQNFITRVFVFHRWQQLCRAGVNRGRLVEFHSLHKLLLMAHSPTDYRELGRLIATMPRDSLRSFADAYFARLMAAFRHRATRRRHANVLQHLAGYLKKRLDAGDRSELAAVIEAFRVGQLPLAAPLTLLRHHFRRYPDPYVERQLYLYPPPAEQWLRSAS
jgi:uncharacterized protein YbgA (DUF1722 family)/uncharacterized protein YbbK (DUF523 family)